MTEREKTVLPLVYQKADEYANNGYLKFIPAAAKRAPKIVILIVVLWLLILCIISVSIIKETAVRVLVVCFTLFFIALVLLLVNNAAVTASVMVGSDKIEIVTQKKAKTKSSLYRLSEVEIKSRLSKNNDAFDGVFYLSVVSDKKKTNTYRINAGAQYDDYIAFAIMLLLIKENPAEPTLKAQNFNAYLTQVLY